MAPLLPFYELTVYADDDTTELFDVSTDPAHARPYLKEPTSFPEQEIDFASGSASIGQINVHVVDVRVTATDQDTGYLTSQLPDATGYSALNGHRALLTAKLPAAAATVVLDGVIKSVKLLDTFSAFEIELRDIRERERTTKAFTSTTTPTIYPRGVLDGYGVSLTIPFFGGTFWFPIPPTQPFQAVYEQLTATRGFFRFNETQPGFLAGDQWVSPKVKAVIDETAHSIIAGVERPDILEHNRWQVLWRDTAAGGAYNTITRVAHTHPDLPQGSVEFPPYLDFRNRMEVFRVNNEISADTLPADTQAVDFILQYTGPPTPDWPHHITGVTIGELLRNLYRGDYSDEDPRIPYDEAALLALGTPCRARIFEPIEDLRAWAETNAYPVVHAAPTLNAAGEISPITYLLPPSGTTPPTLDNDNCRPVGGGWSHGAQDAINLVKVKYRREFRNTPQSEVEEQAAGDMVAVREVEIERRVQASIDLLGESELAVESVLLTAVGSADGRALMPDVRDETGQLVARRVLEMATDRFTAGGQYFALQGDRTDTDVEAAKVGTWVIVAVSWMPDYVSGERGLARLAQIISRRDVSAAWTQFTLLDAGSEQAPFTPSTVLNPPVEVLSTGVVSITVSSRPAGSIVRFDYAVSVLEPAESSELWTFMDRTTGTAYTPPQPQGVTVWVRHRAEAEGRRPSVWTTAGSVTLAGEARIVDATLLIDEAGIPTVRWVPNAAALGVRIHYETTLVGVEPTYPTTLDFDSADLEYLFSLINPVPVGSVFNVQLEGWTGWTGSAVSGTTSDRITLDILGTLDLTGIELEPPPFSELEIYLPLDEGAGLTLRDRSGNLRDAAPAAASPAAVTWVRGVSGMALDFPGAGAGYQLLTDAQAGAIESLFYASFWIKVDTVAGEPTARILTRDTSDYWAIGLGQDEAFPQDVAFWYSATQSVIIDDLITSGAWHFLLAQWDVANTTVELWVGRQDATLARVFRAEDFAGFAASSRPIAIGSNTEAAPDSAIPFDGSIDDIRIGAPAALLTHAQTYSLFKLPGFGSSGSIDGPRPELERHTSQVALVGTLTLVINDPAAVVTATAFEPIAGAGDFDLTTDPSTWAVYDTTSPYTLSDTVAISQKHTSRIGWAVRYTDESGASVWIRGIESFDPDEVAELTGLEIGFEDDGTVVINWSGDEDWSTGYVTVGLGSAPSDPTAVTNDGDLVGQNGSLVLDGTGTTTLRQAAIGSMVFVRVLPETGAAVAGTFQRRRGDSEFVPPRVAVEFDRDAEGDATLTLIITDPSGAISGSPEWFKRAGSQSGDAWGGASTIWDTEPSNPPYSGTWIEALTVPQGEEAGIRWRVPWTDEDGTVREFGFTHYTTKADEHSVELLIPTSELKGATDATLHALSVAGEFSPNSTAAQSYRKGVVLPVGVTITGFSARMYRLTSSDSAIARLRRTEPSQSTLVTLTHATTGYATLASGALSETVGATSTYQVDVDLDALTSATDARIKWIAITYTRHTEEEKY